MTQPMPARLLPHSENAEAALIACLLIDGITLMSVCVEMKMSETHFYEREHAVIFGRLRQMYAAGRPMATETLVEELRNHQEIDQCGGIAGVLRISGQVPTTVKASYFVEQVIKLHLLRRIITEGTRLVDKCYVASTDDVPKELTPPIETMLSLLSGAESDREPTFSELLDEAEQWIGEIEEHGGKPVQGLIPFPWPELNTSFEPMQRGQLVVVGAKTSVGKSSFSRQVAAHCAMHVGPVFFVTLEVNPKQVVLQMAATLGKVGLRELAGASPDAFRDIHKATRAMRNMGLILTRRDRTIAQICAKAKIHHAKSPLAMIVVDYGGLIEDIAAAKPGEQVNAIGNALKALKRLAGDLNCVVLVPWQLNRNSSYQGNREPKLHDLRQSGDVEQDTDKVILLHRPETNPLTQLEQDETAPKSQVPRFYLDVIQAKGRDDGTGRVGLHFERGLASFMSIPNAQQDRPAF